MKTSEYRQLIRHRAIGSPGLWIALTIGVVAAGVTNQLSLFNPLPNGWTILVAIPLGHVAFGIALVLNKLSWKYAWGGFRGSWALVYRRDGGQVVLYYLLLAVAEELLFRALPILWWGSSGWQLFLYALAFAACHPYGRKAGPQLMYYIDLFIFGLALGALYTVTEQLWCVVVVHWVRNSCVAKTTVKKQG